LCDTSSISDCESCSTGNAETVVQTALTVYRAGYTSSGAETWVKSISTVCNACIIQSESWAFASVCIGISSNASSKSILFEATWTSSKNTGVVHIVEVITTYMLTLSIDFLLTVVAV